MQNHIIKQPLIQPMNRRRLFAGIGAGVIAAPFIMASAAEAANIAKHTPGGVSAWASAGFTASDFNSLANGSCVVAATAIDNTTNLDLLAEFYIEVVNGATTSASYSSLLVYVLPLGSNGSGGDGTVYGDGAATGTTPPAANYVVANIIPKSGTTSGGTMYGTSRPFPIPRGKFKFAVRNLINGALNASAAAIADYRTTNRNLNG